MGKTKEQKVELMNAFSRMNFLFQASIIASKAAPDTVLGNYYGRLMKEVSKKLVEKIHPDIKRSLCSSCSYPLFTNDNHASVKVRPHKKKKCKRKNRDRVKNVESGSGSQKKKYCDEVSKLKKDLKPNKVLWSCNNCGFTRKFLQRPSHSLWIDMCHDDSGTAEEQQSRTKSDNGVSMTKKIVSS